MKILLVSSDALHTAEVVARGLQVRFKLPDQGTPFFTLCSTFNSENEMLPPNVVPFVVEAEFRKVAPLQPLFNKIVHQAGQSDAFIKASKGLVGVIPVNDLNRDDIKRNLEKHGFTVVSSHVNYNNDVANKAMMVTRDASGQELPEDDCADFTVTGTSINFVVEQVGSIACDHFNVGLSVSRQIDKAFSSTQSELPRSVVQNVERSMASMGSMTALRAALNHNSGKSDLARKTEFLDDYITELVKTHCNSFDELPARSQTKVIEKAYILKLISSYDVHNLGNSNNNNVATISDALHRVTSFGDRLKINLDKINSASSMFEMMEFTTRVDMLMSDERFMSDEERYSLLPRVFSVVITEKAESLLSGSGLTRSVTADRVEDYNPKFPASHALNSVVNAFTESETNTNIITHDYHASMTMR